MNGDRRHNRPDGCGPEDEGLSALYRQGRGVEPPEHLDRAILATSREAVKARPRVPFSGGWPIPLSMAAVLLITVLLVPAMRDQAERRPGGDVQSEAPAVPGPAETKSEPRAGAEVPRPAARSEPMLPLMRRRMEAREPAAGGLEGRSLGESAPAIAGPRAKRAPAPAAEDRGDFSGRPPDRWLAYIRRLMGEARSEEAARELKAFLETYPGYPVDQGLLERAGGAPAELP